MKKIILSIFMLSVAVFFSACDTTTDPDPVTQPTNLYITSVPSGAQIWKDGINTGNTTPDSLENLSGTSVSVTLKLDGYNDTTFTETLTAGKTTSKEVMLTVKPLDISNFSNIQLYEIAATGLSGLILSTGALIASSNNTADVYFEYDSLNSSHLRPPSSDPKRYTNFHNGNAPNSDLNDGVDAPVYSSSNANWSSYGKKETQTYYSFLYTDDLHYVKLNITETGGATGPSDPYKWIKVAYKYNNTQKDTRF